MKTLEQLAREAQATVMRWWRDQDGLKMRRIEFTEESLARFRAACRAEALEEAAQRCEQIGVALCDTYGDGAECIRTGEECAAAIREMK